MFVTGREEFLQVVCAADKPQSFSHNETILKAFMRFRV
jgi:hypothetical protein